MPGFSVTPVGPFPTATDDGFPQFLQWQDEGINLGGPDAETVNFVGSGVNATRGTGETEKVVTVEILPPPSLSLQFRDHGVDLGAADATAFDIEGDLTAERVDNIVTISYTTPAAAILSWRDVPGDTVLELTDAENGLSMSGTSGAQVVTVPGDTGDIALDFPDGTAILVYQEGAGGVDVVPVSGVLLNVRSPLTTALAGQFATATLIKRRANEWILCGDLA